MSLMVTKEMVTNLVEDENPNSLFKMWITCFSTTSQVMLLPMLLLSLSPDWSGVLNKHQYVVS